MLHRIKSPFKKRSENFDIKFLQFTRGYNYMENGDDDRDETSSISSFSTNATMDNIPGTGRIIDKCIYQFFGRKLERFLFRISMANLSPDRILQFLWMDDLFFSPSQPRRLDSVIQNIKGNEQIAGMKSLVKQSQSNSLYRSAAALSALIRLTTSWRVYDEFYVSVAAVEPIFHLESLANALNDSHPEKKYFLLLIGIARARLHFLYNDCAPGVTEEFAINCRQKLLGILDSSRSPCHDPLVLVNEACLLLAVVTSSFYDLWEHRHSPSPVVDSLIEAAYYLLTFLVRFLIDQYQTINNMHPPQRLILFTYSRWLANVTDYIIFCMELQWDLPRLLPICAFSILHRIIGNMPHGSLFPRHIPQSLVPLNVFPRRIRNSTPQEDHPIILQSSFSICTTRTRRLLAFPDELRREAGDPMRLEYGWLRDALYNLPPEEKSEEEWHRSLDRARFIQVIESDLTREFLEARQAPCWDPILSYLGNWQSYKKLQRQRHRMGEYCRSNLDWDWDPSSCLKRLFKIDKSKNSSRPEGAVHQGDEGVPAIHRGINGGTLEVSIPEKAQNVLENVVRIRYETEAGEVKYKTFYARPSVEDVTSGGGGGTGPWLASARETDTGLLTGALNKADEAPRDEMTNTEAADEEVRRLRKLNDASDTEDDSASIDSNDTDRPQCDSSIEEWLGTQVSAQMAD